MSATTLWSGMRIPIIMVSGPINSGKTLFGLTIDPNCRRPAAEVEPTTLVYDQEGSAEPYVGGLNFDWRDTRAAVAAGVHNERVPVVASDPRWLRILKEQADCNDSPSASMFRAWYLSLIKIPTGKYAVGICDTFTPLQEGMIDWLRRHHEAFGRTANEYGKASTMFLWPDVKAMLSHILTVDCRLRFQTFVINVHLKNEWSGGSKTGKQIAEGLDVLEKLATLHLELDRTPVAKGKESPRVPAALVKKERLVRFGAVGGEDLPVLPPRIAKCTPDEIRQYIATPPDFSKLKPEERLPDQSLSDDDKLRLQATIASDQRAANEAQVSALEMARLAAERGRYGSTWTPTATDTTTPASGNGNSNGHAPTQSQTATTPAGPPAISQPQLAELVGVMKQVFASGADAQRWLADRSYSPNPTELNADQAVTVLSDLYAMLSAKQRPADPPPAIDASPAGNGQQADGSGPATQQQRDQIRAMTTQLYGDPVVANAENLKFLARFGYSSGMSLRWCEAEQRILELRGLLQPTSIGSGADAPF